MRICHIADVHLDRPFVGMSQAAAEERRRELWDAFRRCLSAAKESGAELLTIGGDLWEEEHVQPDTRNSVAHELAKLDMDVLIACGNHDPRAPGGNYDRATWPPNVHIFGSQLEERRLD